MYKSGQKSGVKGWRGNRGESKVEMGSGERKYNYISRTSAPLVKVNSTYLKYKV